MKHYEDDKAEATMKKQGVPYIVRKLYLRWKPERKFSGRPAPMLELLGGRSCRLCMPDLSEPIASSSPCSHRSCSARSACLIRSGLPPSGVT